MKSEFILAINEITETRALPHDIVLDALRTALISAYRRDVSASSAQKVDAEIDMTSGKATILVEKEVVEQVNDPRTEVAQDYALTLDPNANLGETIMVPVTDTSRKFGRIAAQTAKQVILQKIREAEREALYNEYIDREGDLISGTVQSVSGQGVTLSLGRTEALLPRNQQMPNERYKPHEKVRTFVLEVRKTNRGPQIIVSRSHRNMLKRLLEYEVPEIYNGQVEIKNIAREAGHRSKVAVAALQEGVDPVGACVGMRGIRIENIVRELNDEKIDVIEWNPDPAAFITKALSPARVSSVFLDEDADNGRAGIGTATVIVPDDQLSLAIGREGQNARLAAKLTGWRIDIKSVTEAAIESMADTESTTLQALHEKRADLISEVERILAKRESGRPVMPEEFQVLTQYVKLAEKARLDYRKAIRQEREARLQVVRDKIAPGFFAMQVDTLDWPDAIRRPLQRYETVGELMTLLEVEPEHVAQALQRAPEGALSEIKTWLAQLEPPEVLPTPEAALETVEAEPVLEETTAPETEDSEAVEAEVAAPEAEIEVEVTEAAEETLEEVPAATAEPETPAAVAEDVPEEVPPAIVEPIPEPEPVKTEPEPSFARILEEDAEATGDFFEDDDIDDPDEPKKKRKAKQRRRQLVYDEKRGEVVAKRKRKGSRKRDVFDYDEFGEEEF